MAADAEAGRGGWGENGLESTPLGRLAEPPRAGAVPPSQGALPLGPSPLDWSPQGTIQSVRHLNRCLDQPQPHPERTHQSPLTQSLLAQSLLTVVPAVPAALAPSDPVDLPQGGTPAPGADPLVEAACPAQRISLETEIPEALFDGMRAFIQARPDWDQYSLVTSALAGFLFQHGWADGCVSQHYLDGLFRDEAA